MTIKLSTKAKNALEKMFINKTFIYSILIYSLLALTACDGEKAEITDFDKPSNQELAVLNEINFARILPKEYVSQRLQPLVSSSTGETLTYLNELITQMNSMTPLGALEWSDGLYYAAKEWVLIQGPKGEFSHAADLRERISKYVNWTAYAENLSAGYNNDQAINIVIQLLIDAGVESRGHRKNIFSTTSTHAGAAIGAHKTYKYMCCIDFARLKN